MKYIAYCRKSTDEKNKQILSIDQQIAELKEFAAREHLEVIDFVTEAKTAKIPGREKFAQVLKRIEKVEAQGIVSWHPDRLARNSIDGGKVIYLLDTGKLLDLKFPSFWFESTPQGKFMLSIAFGQSKYYVDNLSENVKRGMKHKIRLGIWPMKAPLGYINNKADKTIEADPETFPIIKKAFQLFAQGGKSFTVIASYMHKFGIVKSDGKPLKINQITRMLKDKFYIGILKYDGEYYQASHKTFISKKLFDEVQKQSKKIERPRGKGHNFAFTGLARCGECNAAITCEEKIKKYKNGKSQTFIYYRCTKKLKPCTQRYLQEPEMEIQIRNMLEKVALPQEWANDWYRWLDRDEEKELSLSEENIAKLKSEMEILDKKMNFLLDSFLDQIIDSEIYKTKKNELFEERLKITEEIERIKQTGSSWLGPMREFVDRALQCGKIARAKNTKEDLAIFAKTVGSDFFLTDRQLVPNYNLGFDTLQALP
ncbi:MAG: recombinase family protein, partial [Patescibacteria group bacterium]